MTAATETEYVTVPCLSIPWKWGRWADEDGNRLPPAPLQQPPVDCAKHQHRAATGRPLDYYVNPRYGQACDCCGHQGTHTVAVDADPATLPACLRAYGLEAALNWQS